MQSSNFYREWTIVGSQVASADKAEKQFHRWLTIPGGTGGQNTAKQLKQNGTSVDIGQYRTWWTDGWRK
jgi:hypothetical protein